MSLVSKLFSRSKSPYLLDVEEATTARVRTAAKVGFATGIARRLFAGALATAIVGSGAAAAFMTYSAAAPAASADWVSDIVCVPATTDGDIDAKDRAPGKWIATAGKSTLMQQSSVGALSPLGLEQLFSAVTARKYATSLGNWTSGVYSNTALESYGGFYPFFDGWSGAYDHDTDNAAIYFYGTGGTSGTNTDPAKAHYRWSIGTKVKFNGGDGDDNQKSGQALFSHSFVDCVNPVRSGVVNLANVVFLPAKVLVTVTNGVYGWSMSLSNNDPSNPIYALQTAVSNLIVGVDGNGLKDQLYLSFLPPILMIATIGLFYQGVVRGRSRGAIGAAMWMLFATVAGYCFVNVPMLIPSGMNNLVQTVSGAISGALINDGASAADYQKVNKNGKLAPASTTNMCSVSGNVGDVVYSFNDEGKVTHTSPQNYVRQTQCSFWYTLVYEPWVTGQFGVANSGTSQYMIRDPRGILAKTTIKLGNATYDSKASTDGPVLNWPLYELTAQAQGRVSVAGSGTFNLSTNNLSEVAFAQLTDVKSVGGDGAITAQYATINGAWAGGNIDRQVGAGMLSFWGSLVAVIFILVSALTLIGLQFSTLFLIAISPFFFLLGVAPGWGRRVLARWFELIVEIVIKRIMVVFVLALYVKFFVIIVNLDLPYLFRLLALAIIAFIALFQRNKITKIFTDSIRFGGNQKILDGSTRERTKKVAKTLGLAAVGTGIAVATAGAGAPVAASMVAGTGLTAAGAAGAGGAAAGGAAAAQSAATAARVKKGLEGAQAATAVMGAGPNPPQGKDQARSQGAPQGKGQSAAQPESQGKAQVAQQLAPQGGTVIAGSPSKGATPVVASDISSSVEQPKAPNRVERIQLEKQPDPGHLDDANANDAADELFGAAPLPVPVPNGPVAPAAPNRVAPTPRLNQIPTTVDVNAINAAAKRQARITAAKRAIGAAAAASGSTTVRSLSNSWQAGDMVRENVKKEAEGTIQKQAALVGAQDAQALDIFRANEEALANDLAQQQVANEQQRLIDRQQRAAEEAAAKQRRAEAEAAAKERRHQERLAASERARAEQATRDEAAARVADQNRRTLNRIDRKLNGPRDGGSGSTGGGSGPRFPRKG